MVRWYLSVAFVGRIAVGKVWQKSAKIDPPKGSIRKQEPWQAMGMKQDWCDTDLGEHESCEAARKAVWDWAEKQGLSK